MSRASSPPLILDFDGSVQKLSEAEIRIDLTNRQEEMRFGCSWPTFKRFEGELTLPAEPGCLFLGSGDYHHLTLVPLRRLAASASAPLDLVVCDNHPDNMRYPFGVHCGSWVRRAAALPGLGHIHVLGITSTDVTWLHAWENNWRPLFSGRLTYWCIGRNASWLKWLRHGQSCRCFATADELLEAFRVKAENFRRIYLSIDKDVFGPTTVKTNWDQGVWEKRHLETLIEALAGRLAGADVTGEVSAYEYRGLFKRILTRLEGLEAPDPAKLGDWQAGQRVFNQEILAMLKKAGY